MSGKKKPIRLPGIIIAMILFIELVCFAGLLYSAKLLPMKLLVVCIGALLILDLIILLLTMNFCRKGAFFAGLLLTVLSTALLAGGFYFVRQGTKTYENISKVSNVQTAHVGVYVKADSGFASVQDTAGATYGILETMDRENTDAAVRKIEEELGSALPVNSYAGMPELMNSLLDGSTSAIILNQQYLGMLIGMEGFEEVESQIREIDMKTVELVKESAPQEEQTVKKEDEPFTVFVSGIDTRGEMTAKSLSDVNIIATINPNTKQVLLVSTPRDYFVPLSISGGQRDKLTHAGIYGVDVCMDTLEMLYDINMDYYFRINFGGFVNIIDALGGITVNSDYEFDSKNILGYHFNEGPNDVDGEAALVFARERYSFAEGDRQRGRNQMAVIRGVVDKAVSPEFLKNFQSILEGVEGSFETTVPYETIAGLVRRQLEDGSSWNIQQYSVNGTGDTQKPYSLSQNAYVMIPDENTVEKAKDLMAKVREGAVLTEADTAEEAAPAEP